MKAVFIDGPSLHHMKRVLGIEDLSYEKFRGFLQNLGSPANPLVGPPLVVLHPYIHQGKDGKAFRTAGFHTIACPTSNGQDDQMLISRIEKLDESIQEIIIVSADQDFAPSLRKKFDAGVKIYWVATRTPKEGFSMIGRELNRLFKKKEFNFVELGSITSYQPPTVLSPQKPETNKVSEIPFTPRPLRLTLEDATLEDRQEFLKAITSLATRLPHLRVNIEA